MKKKCNNGIRLESLHKETKLFRRHESKSRYSSPFEKFTLENLRESVMYNKTNNNNKIY